MSVREEHMFRLLLLSIFVSISIFLFTGTATAQFSIPGQIVDIVDGKTVLFAMPSGKVKIELQYIDVPESGQVLHDVVKDHLRGLVVGKFAEYRPKSMLSEHAIGQLTVKGVDVSEQMLRDGAAWHVPFETSGQEKAEYNAYAAIEALAKTDKIGIWSFPGLTPAREYRTHCLELAKLARQRQEEEWKAAHTTRRNVAVRKNMNGNPAFGDVGALFNRYDSETRTGLLSTMYLALTPDASWQGETNMAMDISYYYKEDWHGVRKGTFVLSIAVIGTQLIGTNLVVLDEGKTIPIGKPTRVVSKRGEGGGQILMYRIPRETIERCAKNEDVYLKIGQQLIYLRGSRYLLFNMLQITQ
jgi:endonuclease YncB( thermonuclease family)